MESDSGDSSRKRSREPSDSPLHVTISESPELTIIDLTSLGIDPEEIRQQKELEERFSKRHRLQTEQDAAFAQLLYKQINGHEDIEAERERQRQRESQQESLRLELDRRRELARKLQQGEERSAEIERERALERERERQIEKGREIERLSEQQRKRDIKQEESLSLELTEAKIPAVREAEIGTSASIQDITYENISSIVSLAQQAKTEGSSSTGSPINITAGSSSASVSAISTPPTGSEGSSPTSYDDFIDLTAEDEHLARQLQDQELTILDNHLIGSNASTPLVISSKSSLSALASSSNRQHWAYGSYIRGAQESKGKEAFSDFASDIQKALDEGYYIKLDDDLLMKAQSYSSSTAALNDINQIMRRFDNLSHTANTTPYPAESSGAEKSKHISRHAAERQLRALLKTIENDKAVEVLDRTGTPTGLIPPLMDHQVTGLQWLHKMEENTNKGGILADDMGLGKTIQMIALILSRPCKDADFIPPISTLTYSEKDKMRLRREPLEVRRAEHEKQKAEGLKRLKTKSTLVVCPVSLVCQWKEEIDSKTSPPLKVVLHHGSNRESTPEALADADVIITSYTLLVSEYGYDLPIGPLYNTHFHRVILDEAHAIKNRATRVANACSALNATHRWCLTATPIQNRVSDLYSLIRFLQIEPYNAWKEFAADIDRPLSTTQPGHAMKRVQILMKAISLRRTKDAMIDGKPLLKLPARRVHIRHVEFTEDEHNFYDYLNAKAQAKFTKYFNSGTVMKHYTTVLVLILRLRQACLHPALTTDSLPAMSRQAAQEEDYKKLARTMDPPIVQRLLNQNLNSESTECPICMDVANSPFIITRCGHCFCEECLFNMMNVDGATVLRSCQCPQCRQHFKKCHLLPVEIFLDVHDLTFHKTAAITENADDSTQAINVPVLRPNDFVSSTKIDTMLEILAETRRATNNADKTVIFTQFTTMLDLIEKPLKAAGYKYVRYDGSMNMAAKNAAIQRLKDDPTTTIMIISMKCGSLGLNLTAANRVILLDVWWNPALENQAIDRVHRIGQTKDVDVHRILVKDTFEDRILDLQRKKQAIADGVLSDGSSQQLGRLGLNELLHLFRGPVRPS